eukprot:g41658.t1
MLGPPCMRRDVFKGPMVRKSALMGSRRGVEYEVLLFQFPGRAIVTLEKAQNGHVTQGVGGGVEMVHDWKVLLFIMNRVQVPYKVFSEPQFGLANVEKTTSGEANTIDYTDGSA